MNIYNNFTTTFPSYINSLYNHVNSFNYENLEK